MIMFGLAELLAGTLAGIFVGYDADLMMMTKRAFMIYSFSFLWHCNLWFRLFYSIERWADLRFNFFFKKSGVSGSCCYYPAVNLWN